MRDTKVKTLQELLETKVKSKNFKDEEVEISPEFRVSVQRIIPGGGVHIIIHPMGHNGDTLDFLVNDNILRQILPISRPPNPPGDNKPRGPWDPIDPSRQCG